MDTPRALLEGLCPSWASIVMSWVYEEPAWKAGYLLFSRSSSLRVTLSPSKWALDLFSLVPVEW